VRSITEIANCALHRVTRMRALIVVGERTTRVRPYTTVIPKSLLPVGRKPVIEIIVNQLKHHGFTHITICLGHSAYLVQRVLGNGEKLGLVVDYHVEEIPLWTHDPLALTKDIDGTFLVMNGDILSDINYTEMIRFHREQGATATVAFPNRVPEIDSRFQRRGHVSAGFGRRWTFDNEEGTGIYVLDSSVLAYLVSFFSLDFPGLIRTLIGSRKKVIPFRFSGIWYDLGLAEDFRFVQDHFNRFKKSIPWLT